MGVLRIFEDCPLTKPRVAAVGGEDEGRVPIVLNLATAEPSNHMPLRTGDLQEGSRGLGFRVVWGLGFRV